MKYTAIIFMIFAWALNAEVRISDTLSVHGYIISAGESQKPKEQKSTEIISAPSSPFMEIRLIPQPDDVDFSDYKLPLMFQIIEAIDFFSPQIKPGMCG